jgi:SpoIID/LytB domain protein
MYSSGSGIKSLTIYGGGYGHGAGMSQYGVIGLVRQGKNFEEILNVFYKNVQFNDYHKLIESLS